MSKADFQNVSFGFFSEQDPTTGQKIEFVFDVNAFVKVEDTSASQALFKMAAHDVLSKCEASYKVQNSIKYQVLCDETAMVGIMKTKDLVTGELKQIE